jgi:acetyl esterase/lipase
MKNRPFAAVLLLLVLLTLPAVESFAQDAASPDSRFTTYEDARTHLTELFRAQKYGEAVELLEWSRDRFPDHVYANSFNLALVHLRTGEREKSVEALAYALDRGVFFGKWDLENPAFASLEELDSFLRVKERSNAMLAEAEEKASMKIDVVTPDSYSPDKSWPLFIALHGGGESLASFKPKWTSVALSEKFIVAYVQSSQVASMTGFHWQNEEKTERELRQAWEEIRAGYRIDPDVVLIGGFSSGGFASLVVTFGETFPVRGFVALCPPVPESITNEMVERAATRDLQGTVLSTEFDRRLDAQRAFVARLEDAGVDVDLVVTPDVGHWYPDDLGALIDEAIERIMD